MFCRKCGKEIPDDSLKCQYCGVDLQKEIVNESDRKVKKKRKWLKNLIIIIVAIGIIGVLFGGEDSSTEETSEGTPGSDEKVTSMIKSTDLTMEDIQKHLMNDTDDAPIRVNSIEVTPPDMANLMQIKWKTVNQTEKDIKKAVFGVVAWDVNELPLKLKPYLSVEEEAVCKVYFENIPQGKKGEYNVEVSYEDVGYINIVLLEYEDFEGNTWTNPAKDYYEDMANKPIDDTTMAYTLDSNE